MLWYIHKILETRAVTDRFGMTARFEWQGWKGRHAADEPVPASRG